MRLIRLTLHNFKGVRDFTLEPDGKDVNVWGDNETGKTTLADAFLWVVTGKDSEGRTTGRKGFDIKTQDAAGEVLHNLEHSAEAVINVDGRIVTLKKVYHEDWKKQRGSAVATFSGHTTEHFIDGVPKSESEYKAEVAALVDEKVLRLVMDPAHFNGLPWEQRRAIVFDVCGDVSAEDVVASNTKLARLPELLGDRTVEDTKKVLAARRKQINDELGKIPVRIAEVDRGLPPTPAPLDPATPTAEQIDKQVAQAEAEIARIEAGGQAAELVKRQREVEAALLELDNEDTAALNAAKAAADAVQSAKRTAVSDAKDALATIVADRDRAQNAINENTTAIDAKQRRMTELREKWDTHNALVYSGTIAEACPTCKHPLPPDEVQAARDKALADFNRDKAETLEAINAEGLALKAQSDELAGKNEALRGEVARLNEAIAAQETVVAEKQAAADAPTETPAVQVNPKRVSLESELATVKESIVSLESDTGPQIEALRTRVTDLKAIKTMLDAQQTAIAAIAKGKQRIAELAGEDKDLSREFEQLEADLFLTEEFVRAKVALLDERVNARFAPVAFRLFEQQVNGGLSECCETLYKGVAYSSGLNNAGRIAAGLFIIKTLSEHYGITAPIFIDNCEAITHVPEMDSQVIALYVSEADKCLRIEGK